MKKFFTLLFCVVALGLSANASDFPIVDKCINVLLGTENPKTIMATDLDANHDGVISISDVTTLIDQQLSSQGSQRAPMQDIDVDALIDEVLKSKTGDPNIHDVNKAIEHNLNNQNK